MFTDGVYALHGLHSEALAVLVLTISSAFPFNLRMRSPAQGSLWTVDHTKPLIESLNNADLEVSSGN